MNHLYRSILTQGLFMLACLATGLSATGQETEKLKKFEETVHWTAPPNPFMDGLFQAFNYVTIFSIVIMLVCGSIWLAQRYVFGKKPGASRSEPVEEASEEAGKDAIEDEAEGEKSASED